MIHHYMPQAQRIDFDNKHLQVDAATAALCFMDIRCTIIPTS